MRDFGLFVLFERHNSTLLRRAAPPNPAHLVRVLIRATGLLALRSRLPRYVFFSRCLDNHPHYLLNILEVFAFRQKLRCIVHRQVELLGLPPEVSEVADTILSRLKRAIKREVPLPKHQRFFREKSRLVTPLKRYFRADVVAMAVATIAVRELFRLDDANLVRLNI